MRHQLHGLAGVLAHFFLDLLGKLHAKAHVAIALLGGVRQVAVEHHGVQPAGAAHPLEHGFGLDRLQNPQGEAEQSSGECGQSNSHRVGRRLRQLAGE